MRELRTTNGFGEKWRRRRLALACLFIAFCFLLSGDAYRAKAIVSPVAAGVNIGGRIANANGIGISGARVSLTYPSGEVLTVKTNAFGYYKFEDLEVGSTYMVQVADKRHQFANPSQIITLNDAIEDLDFTALP